jgi:hypothetical protein
MSNPLEKEETAQSILIKTALMEAPFLLGGFAAWFLTDQWIWLIAGIVLGGAMWIPALSKLKRIGERSNASG